MREYDGATAVGDWEQDERHRHRGFHPWPILTSVPRTARTRTIFVHLLQLGNLRLYTVQLQLRDSQHALREFQLSIAYM